MSTDASNGGTAGDPAGGPAGGPAGSVDMPRCLRDNRKMTIAASLCTMIFCFFCGAFLIEGLIYDHHKGELRQVTPVGDAPDFTKAVTKFMYTALVCNLLVLLLSSVALLKGIFQKKRSPMITWMLIIIVTMVYAGAVITRDVYIQLSATRSRHLSGTVSAELGFYSFFVIMEAGFMRFVVQAFKESRRTRALRRLNTAVSDPRNPGHSLFTISGNLTPQRPETLFKLPSYEEVTSDSTPGTSSENKTENTSEDTPPRYEPLVYAP